jgi:hypothetical protein
MNEGLYVVGYFETSTHMVLKDDATWVENYQLVFSKEDKNNGCLLSHY